MSIQVMRTQTIGRFIICSLLFTALAVAQGAPASDSGLRTADPGQVHEAPPSQPPDERYKADILVILAQPDDETAVGAYLARAIFDEHRRVAVVFGTRGDAGGNAMGYEQAGSLGPVREIEARRALAWFGVMNVWFLGAPDTPGQDVLRSLETWNHGATLWMGMDEASTPGVARRAELSLLRSTGQ